MKEIGQKLRERREELGFTLEQMCEKTKVTIPNLKAIEAGDLEYFDNDLFLFEVLHQILLSGTLS